MRRGFIRNQCLWDFFVDFLQHLFGQCGAQKRRQDAHEGCALHGGLAHGIGGGTQGG